jgi:hypothetical protein
MVVIILPSKRMTSPLSQFRDLTCLLFRVVDPHARFEDVDRLVNKLHDILSDGASTPRPAFLEPLFVQELLRPPTPPTLVIHPDQKAEPIPPADIIRPEPESSTVRNFVYNSPAIVHAVKLESSVKSEDIEILKDLKDDTDSVTTPDDQDVDVEDEVDDVEDAEADSDEEVESDSDEEVESDEEEEEAEVEEEEEDEEAEKEEEEEEEEEDIELLKIKKDKYYWSPTSKRVYEYLEKGYGDCIGIFMNGKIEPKKE